MRIRLRHLIVLAVAVAIASPSFAAGNANFVAGRRSLRKNLWEPVEDQRALQLTVDFGKEDWPVNLEIVVSRSEGKEENVFDPTVGITGDVTGTVTELAFGAVKVWDMKGRMRPFFGGGFSNVIAKIEVAPTSGSTVSEDDVGLGIYVHGGVFWRLGSRINVGIEGRVLYGSIIKIADEEGDADHGQLGLLLGYGWPARK